MIIIGCIVGLWVIGKMFSIPLKAIFKLIANSVLGGILIFMINLIGSAFSFHIGLNIGTSILVGILGIPRCCFINCIENIYVIKISFSINARSLFSISYSTVTDLAKFLGLSTSKPLALEI